VHLVFSTKNREPWLADEIRDELHAYIGGVGENHKGTLLKSGSVADHIHLLIAQPRTCAPAELVQEIKTGSSKWLLMNGMCGIDLYFALSGLGMFGIMEPRALPWAITFGPFGAGHRRNAAE
jgi:REP element-mobilizing transposase RayT